MALGGGTPLGGVDGAAVRHVVVLERQRVGHQPTLGVVWGECGSSQLEVVRLQTKWMSQDRREHRKIPLLSSLHSKLQDVPPSLPLRRVRHYYFKKRGHHLPLSPSALARSQPLLH